MSSVKPPPAGPRAQFTPRQVAQLQQLLNAGAVGRESGKHQFDEGMADCSPLVIGKLRDLGLADSRSVTTDGGARATAYWLTRAGAAVARRLAASPPLPRSRVR